MTAGRWGRILLTVVLLGTIATEIASTWLGWTGGHLAHPLWPPHATFSTAHTSIAISVLNLVALGLLWGRSGDPRRVAKAITALQVCWWASQFVANALVGTGASPGLAHPDTVNVAGLAIPANLLLAGLMLALTRAGTALFQRLPPDPSPSPGHARAASTASQSAGVGSATHHDGQRRTSGVRGGP